MRAAEVLRVTGCKEATLKDWLRRDLIVPARASQGSGVYAEYDESNIVAIGVAMTLVRAHVKVIKYLEAFRELQSRLRITPRGMWSGLQVVFLGDQSTIMRSGESDLRSEVVISVDLDRVLLQLGFVSGDSQMELEFGLYAVS